VIRDMSMDEAIDAMLNNVKVRLEGWYCKPSDFGYFAYAPVAMEKYLKRLEEQKRREAEKSAMANGSNYVGTIGARDTFNIKEAVLLTSFDGYYGKTFLYRFIDKTGNVLVWFASTTLDTDHVSKIKATVKDHTEHDGVKQTVVTRVKVA